MLGKYISKFVDVHIKDYVPTTKSYVRDTQHFISKLLDMGHIPEGALLVTLYVSSLYTNIPNHEGLIAVVSLLRKDRTKRPHDPLHTGVTQISATKYELYFQ